MTPHSVPRLDGNHRPAGHRIEVHDSPQPTTPSPVAIAAALDAARELAAIVASSPVDRIELSLGGVRWEVERARPPVSPDGRIPAALVQAQAPSEAPDVVRPATPPVAGQVVVAPLIGVYYQAPEPGRARFASVGDRVETGQQVAIVEAMKMMNEVVAPCSGQVVAIHADDGDIVEHGQPLLTIDPD